MCGICGYVGIQADSSVLQSMIKSLAHRGPDDSGHWIRNGTALGHTRLAIIDLSKAARQPMTTQDGRYIIVFNGEIYNYQTIRQELAADGEVFRSASDTEAILLGYRTWGIDILERLQGMFAFAIWDNELQELFLARDRIGIKPLFYAPVGNGLVFGSEIKATLEHPMLHREMNPASVDSYLRLGYVPGPDTIFQGVQSMMPGVYLKWKGGTLGLRQYWAPDFKQPSWQGNETDLIDELDEKLNDAVKAHLVSDVPVGAFLSGGIDSSLVAAIAQRNSSEPLRTYTIGFSGGGDEREFARTVAVHIHSNHHEQLITSELVNELPKLIWHLDQPLFDNSILPTYLVSRFAREDIKVVLSGDGGDEPFAGYDWTRYALSLPNLPKLWTPSRWQWAYQCGLGGTLKKLIYDSCHGQDARYLRRMTVSDSFLHWLYTREFCEQLSNYPSRKYVDSLLREAPVHANGDRFVYTDLCSYLPEDILFKVDRMSMANGLEVRVPLLDHHLLGWILRLPFSMRFRHARGKYLLRKLAARYLPPAILKPRKQGFTVPVGHWLHGELGDLATRIFSSKAFKQRNIVRPEGALDLLAMHRNRRYELGHRIWSLVILEVWARVWLDGQDPSHDLATLLAEVGD